VPGRPWAGARTAIAPTVIFAATAAGWLEALVLVARAVLRASIAAPAAEIIRACVLHVNRVHPENFGAGVADCLVELVLTALNAQQTRFASQDEIHASRARNAPPASIGSAAADFRLDRARLARPVRRAVFA
jgi:hypothetical protein